MEMQCVGRLKVGDLREERKGRSGVFCGWEVDTDRRVKCRGVELGRRTCVWVCVCENHARARARDLFVCLYNWMSVNRVFGCLFVVLSFVCSCVKYPKQVHQEGL